MKTPNLDREINDLSYYETNNELTDQGRNTIAEFREIKEQLTIPVVVEQSEQLKPMVFKLANKLAIAGHGDAAVSMHRIHNRL